MANPINRSSFATDLLPIVRKWHDNEMATHEPLTPKLFDVFTSDRTYEIMGVSMGGSTMQEKGEMEDITYDTNRQLYNPQFNHSTYALGYKISMEALQDSQAIQHAKRVGRMLARGERETRDILSANIVNNAYTSGKTMTGGDGVILCSASHPSPVGNQSNTIGSNADLSEAMLETLFIQIRKAVDERGLKANIKPRKLVVPVDLIPEVERILGTQQRVSTADNDISYIATSGMFPEGYVASSHFTDTDQVLILTDAMDGLIAFDRYTSGVETDREFDTKTACFSKVIRTSRGWVEWRAVYGSPGV